SDGYRVYDADGIEVANTFTPELALGSAKAVAKDIAEAVNAYYGVGHARIDLLSSEVDRLQSLFAKAQTKANEQARRAEKAEARGKELEKTHNPDTFTAADGRVFRVGQRVKGDLSGLFSTIVGVNGNGLITKYKSGIANTEVPAENLRRVWDGEDEPDVPVGTVLRDSYGCYLERLSGTRWELQNEKGEPLDNDEWVNLDGEQFRPYVEVLPGDDE